MTVQDLTGQPTRLVVTQKNGICNHVYAQTFRAGGWRSLYMQSPIIFESSISAGTGKTDHIVEDYNLAIKAWLNWKYLYMKEMIKFEK